MMKFKSNGPSNSSAIAMVCAAAAGITLAVTGALAATAPFTKQQAEDGHVKFNNNCAQ